jgi:hypothetical protein
VTFFGDAIKTENDANNMAVSSVQTQCLTNLLTRHRRACREAHSAPAGSDKRSSIARNKSFLI